MRNLATTTAIAVCLSVSTAHAASFDYSSTLTLMVTGFSGPVDQLDVTVNDAVVEFGDSFGNAGEAADASVVGDVVNGLQMTAQGSGFAFGPAFSFAFSEREMGLFLEAENFGDADVSVDFLLTYDLVAAVSGLDGEIAYADAGFDLFRDSDKIGSEVVMADLFAGIPVSDTLSGSLPFTMTFAANGGFSDIEVYAFGYGEAESDVAPIPLPAGGGLLLAAFAGLAALRARRAAR